MKYFTTVNDLSDPVSFITEAVHSKSVPPLKEEFKGKTIGMIFMNPSLRTRLSMQKAAISLGMDVMILNAEKDSWSIEWEDNAVMIDKTEHIRELAAMLSLYCDMIAVRCFASLTGKEKDESEFQLLQLMKYSTVPVISLESATLHPLQSLADMMTIIEHQRSDRPKVVLSWAPHVKPLPQAVANSFCEWMKFMNAEFIITNPAGYNLSPLFTGDFPVSGNQQEALQDADFVYVKSWSSYSDYGTLPEVKENWMLTPDKMKHTNNAKVMHCLPVRRNIEIPDELLLPQTSLIHEQAANRYYAVRFVLTKLAEHNFHRHSPVTLNEYSYE